MNAVVLYAELVRSLMRAAQHLTLRDLDGQPDALNALRGWRLDEPDITETVENLYGRIEAAETSDDILDAIDGLTALAEKTIATQLTRLKVEIRPFQLTDWPAGLADALDPGGDLFGQADRDLDDLPPLDFGEPGPDPDDEVDSDTDGQADRPGPRFR